MPVVASRLVFSLQLIFCVLAKTHPPCVFKILSKQSGRSRVSNPDFVEKSHTNTDYTFLFFLYCFLSKKNKIKFLTM